MFPRFSHSKSTSYSFEFSFGTSVNSIAIRRGNQLNRFAKTNRNLVVLRGASNHVPSHSSVDQLSDSSTRFNKSFWYIDADTSLTENSWIGSRSTIPKFPRKCGVSIRGFFGSGFTSLRGYQRIPQSRHFSQLADINAASAFFPLLSVKNHSSNNAGTSSDSRSRSLTIVVVMDIL